MTLLQRKCPLTIGQQIPVVWPSGRQVPTANNRGMPKSRLGKILKTMQSLQWPSTGRETADLWDGGLQRSRWVLAVSSISDCCPASLGVHYCSLPRGDSWIPSTATIIFLWCQCHDLYLWKTKYKWGKQGGALSEMWCKQLQRCGCAPPKSFPTR